MAKNAFHLRRRQALFAALRAAAAATLSTLTASSFQASVLIGQNGGVRRSGDTSIPNCFTKYIAVCPLLEPGDLIYDYDLRLS
jgi:hypothetical protein